MVAHDRAGSAVRAIAGLSQSVSPSVVCDLTTSYSSGSSGPSLAQDRVGDRQHADVVQEPAAMQGLQIVGADARIVRPRAVA